MYKDVSMDWKEKIFTGMKFIVEGCTEPHGNCTGCPFEALCDELVAMYWDVNSPYGAPDTWDI